MAVELRQLFPRGCGDSAWRARGGWARPAAQAGPPASRLATTSVAGTTRRTAARGTTAGDTLPAPLATRRQVQRPRAIPAGTPSRRAPMASVVACQATVA